MMTKKEILNAFNDLNQRLADEQIKSEMCLVGGAVMCIVFNVRQQTKDVDAIFEPKSKVNKLAKQTAEAQGLNEDWLNDAAKGYVNDKLERIAVLTLSNLKIFAPSARYMLAMKCMASRIGTSDESDIRFLIEYLKLKTTKDVMDIVTDYFDQRQILPKTTYLIEHIVASLDKT